jgi:hypothetical protein
MTKQRDLKRRIRQRMRRTGERYTAARDAVVAQPGRPSWFIELHDVTTEARAVGLACTVRMTSTLADEIGAERVLGQITEILRAAGEELGPMRRVALLGERNESSPIRTAMAMLEQFRSFFDSVDRGLRGAGPGGVVLAFELRQGASARTVIAHLFASHAPDSVLVLCERADLSLGVPIPSIVHVGVVIPMAPKTRP